MQKKKESWFSLSQMLLKRSSFLTIYRFVSATTTLQLGIRQLFNKCRSCWVLLRSKELWI